MTIAGDVSHTLPSGSLPVSAMREQLSKSYLHMIGSAAGLTLGEWGTDYDGVDSSVKSHVEYPTMLQPKIDIQLKCTGQLAKVHDDHVSWSLETRTVRYLKSAKRSSMALFCVLVAPDEPGYWLALDEAGLLARSHMYWVKGHDLPDEIPSQETQTVHLPIENTLTAKSILDLMEEASAWRPS